MNEEKQTENKIVSTHPLIASEKEIWKPLFEKPESKRAFFMKLPDYLLLCLAVFGLVNFIIDLVLGKWGEAAVDFLISFLWPFIILHISLIHDNYRQQLRDMAKMSDIVLHDLITLTQWLESKEDKKYSEIVEEDPFLRPQIIINKLEKVDSKEEAEQRMRELEEQESVDKE